MTEVKNDQEEVIEELPEVVEGEEDNTDWKALALKNQGIAKRLKTKLEKKEEIKDVEEPKAKLKKKKSVSKEKGFDYAQKAFMKVNDVTSKEYPLVQDIMDATGKDLDEVLESKYFRAEQKELREAEASADAIPDGTKRSAQTSRDKVDYWLAKGEMPPADQVQLRRDYVNAKLKKAEDVSKFSDKPVVQ